MMTSLRFAPASALLIQFLSRVQSQCHPEKDLMGLFSSPFRAVRAGFDNRCRIKRVQGVRECVVIGETISDCIIPILPAFTERAALVKGRVICIGLAASSMKQSHAPHNTAL